MIDHLIYATPDVAASAKELEHLLGVPAIPGGQHPEWGTCNALIGLGRETYLEIIGPDPESHCSALPKLFGIDKIQSPSLITWAAKSSELDVIVGLAQLHGMDLGRIRTGGRSRPDGVQLSWRLTDPMMPRSDGIVPFFIDWGGTRHPANDLPQGCSLFRLRAEHPSPDSMNAILLELGLELEMNEEIRPALIATISTARGAVEIR